MIVFGLSGLVRFRQCAVFWNTVRRRSFERLHESSSPYLLLCLRSSWHLPASPETPDTVLVLEVLRRITSHARPRISGPLCDPTRCATPCWRCNMIGDGVGFFWGVGRVKPFFLIPASDGGVHANQSGDFRWSGLRHLLAVIFIFLNLIVDLVSRA